MTKTIKFESNLPSTSFLFQVISLAKVPKHYITLHIQIKTCTKFSICNFTLNPRSQFFIFEHIYLVFEPKPDLPISMS